jgi:hypothetical protein
LKSFLQEREGFMNHYKHFLPPGKAISKAQWHFYKRCLDECDPKDTARRKAFIDALDVNYNSLPDRKGSIAPKAQPTPPPKPKAQPRVEAIKAGKSTVCYVVRKPMPVFFIAKEEVWKVLHSSMPDLKRAHCLTLAEARSFLELEGVKVKSLKEAATLWASESPEGAIPPIHLPQPPAPEDNCECGGHCGDSW